MHMRVELRERNLTGGAFVTVLDRRVYENGHGHALTGIIDGHGYGWNGSRRYDCHLRLRSWFSCMHFYSMAWCSSGHAPVLSCHRDGLAPCEFHSKIVLFLLSCLLLPNLFCFHRGVVALTN